MVFKYYAEAKKEWDKYFEDIVWYSRKNNRGSDDLIKTKKLSSGFNTVIDIALFDMSSIEIAKLKAGWVYSKSNNNTSGYGGIQSIYPNEIELIFKGLDVQTIKNLKEVKITDIKTGQEVK